MRILILTVGALIGLTQTATAASLCVPGTLATYIALGSSGCMIGNDTIGSFQVRSGITGATPIAPANIGVTTSGSSSNPAITFQFGQTASGSTILEAIFSYQIIASSITGSMISLAGGSVTNNAAVTDIQDFCRGGVFGSNGVSGCTGVAGELLIFNAGSGQSTFAPASFLNVTDDFTLDGGGDGTASALSITDTFTASGNVGAVPEPASFALIGMGALLFGFRNRHAIQKQLFSQRSSS